MASASTNGRRIATVTAAFAVTALAISGCAGTSGGKDDSSNGNAKSITIGTTDKVTTLDPAGSYDNGSFAVMNQVFPFLMNTPYGSPDVEPDIAESAEFTTPTQYTVTLKEGLTWANGNELTSSDVKFSFDRQLAIADANGPSALLYNLESVETPDELTAVFNLKQENDQVFAQILSSPAGPIVDEEVFSADAVTPDKEIVDGNAFAGQYTIASYDFNNLVSYKANPDYQGLLGKAETATVNVKYFAESSNLKLAVQEGDIDVAH
ncbi:MAG: ABC transporter substrate-binding protein, partial [Mycetocola sp.]